MRVLERLQSRRQHWQELEKLCGVMERGWRKVPSAEDVSRFADLYRSACADLALADAYQLPPATIQYLHQLVGRAHNRLYRYESGESAGWYREVFVNVPRRLYADGCLRLAFALFWGIFLLCMLIAWRDPDYAPQIVGKELLLGIEQQFSHQFDAEGDQRTGMAGFYAWHNGTIGMRCFAFGLLAGIGGLYETAYNAAVMGAIFGYMARSPNSGNFYRFVAAHSPFELTAIVLMAAAGMRLGFSLVDTGGRSRADALYHAARKSVPVMSVGVALLLLAAGIEAFVSPSRAPYELKAGVSLLSIGMLIAYFALGYPGRKGCKDEP
jgi:uncharacterized membrane protein SpoIIM required for sporulation